VITSGSPARAHHVLAERVRQRPAAGRRDVVRHPDAGLEELPLVVDQRGHRRRRAEHPRGEPRQAVEFRLFC
jgi:hypothetical protein